MRKDKYPELPDGYQYSCYNSRIRVSYLNNGLRTTLRKNGSVEYQYWTKPENAALAAWKHYGQQLKERSH